MGEEEGEGLLQVEVDRWFVFVLQRLYLAHAVLESSFGCLVQGRIGAMLFQTSEESHRL